eukprot:6472928-Pyramimonas_sp.AAC.1
MPRHVLDTAFTFARDHVKCWGQVVGPLGAALLSMQRIGWGAVALGEWVLHDGATFRLGDFSPWYVQRLVLRGCE